MKCPILFLLTLTLGTQSWTLATDATSPPVIETDPAGNLYLGQARFVPRLVDKESGVGCQVTTADVNDDGRPDLLTVSKQGAVAFLNSAQPASGAAEPAAAWNTLGETQELGAGITPGICVDSSGVVHVVFMGGGTIFYRRADAPGRFGPAEELPLPEGAADYNSPHLVSDAQGRLHLTFERDFTRNSKKGWYANRRDGKWQPPVLVLERSGPDQRVNYPRLAVRGDEVFIGSFTSPGSTVVKLVNVGAAPAVAGSVETPLWVAHPLVDPQGQLWVVGRDGPRGHKLERYSDDLRLLGERVLLSRGAPAKTGEPTAAIVDETGVVHAAGGTRSTGRQEVLWYSNSERAAAGKDVILGPDLGDDIGEEVYPVLLRDARGKIHVSYRDLRTGEARVSVLDERAEKFAPPVVVAPAVTKRLRWNPHLAAAPGGGAYVVWDADGRVHFRSVGVSPRATPARTQVSLVGGRWHLNGEPTHPGTRAEGLLMNVRMVNAVFEDANERTCPKGFDADANTDAFIAKIPDYMAHGVRSFTLGLQGGHCGYEGAVNSAFNPDGSLRESYLQRVRRVIEACDRHGAAVILGCYYQRQDQILRDEAAVRAGVVNAAKWIQQSGFANVVLEVANEFAHPGYDHKLLKSAAGEAELIALAKQAAPGLLVSTSGMGSGKLPEAVAKASDFLLVHFNTTSLDDLPARIAELKKYGKPIVCNEDDKLGAEGVTAAELCVANGAAWGFMHSAVNQYFPKLSFHGAADDPLVYATLKRLTAPADYFPPPDAAGGWRALREAEEIHRVAGMERAKLDEAFAFIQGSSKHGGLLVVRRGWLVYENYFGLGHRDATPNLASCGKSFTSIAVGMLMAERPALFPDGLEQKIFTPRYFPPDAFPLSDARKADIKLGQLLAFTAGIRGNNPSYVKGKETKNDPVGPDGWKAMVDDFAFGKRDGVTGKIPFSAATLWCVPGEGYSYSSSSIHLASVMLRHVTGTELQAFLEARLAQPLGWGRWGYSYKQQPDVTHTPGGGGIALRATDMLRFGYLLLREGRWSNEQVVPGDYVRLCARKSPYNPHFPYSLQFNVNTDGEIPELPRDAFWKGGSGGHCLYVVPSLDLVVWKLGGRDEQYSPTNTGLPASPAPKEQVATRQGWKETVEDETARRATLKRVIEAIIPPPNRLTTNPTPP